MIKVGIPVLFTGSHWMGGINYFNSLLSAINELPVCNLNIIVLTNDPDIFERHSSDRIKIVGVKKKSKFSLLIKKVVSRVFDADLDLRQFIIDYDIDVVTHVQPSKLYNAKTIWWKPDFQEKHLPAYFTRRDIKLRNKAVLKSIENKKIMFSSNDAKSDFNHFYKNSQDVYAPVLQFVPFLNSNDLDNARVIDKQVEIKYGIDKPFLYLPNQFWAHKNHDLVFRAMKDISSDVYLVVTGSMNDYRNKDHIEDLKKLAAESNGKIKMLGLISREEMIYLMKKSVAVINPSKFEGWSTTVEESKYLGKRMILSYLNVHLEQDPPESIYVKCEDVLAMSKAIDSVYANFDMNAEIKRREDARVLYLANKIKFAEQYIELVSNIFNKKYL